MLTLDLTYIGIQGYPNFNTFLGSMLISFQVGEQASPWCWAQAGPVLVIGS